MNSPEKVACLYLRLNGFFLLPNFTVFDGHQHTDIDIIGLRAAEAVERVGQYTFPLDASLTDVLPMAPFVALVVQVKGTECLSWPSNDQVTYVQSLVGSAAIERAAVSLGVDGIQKGANGIQIGLAHAAQWIRYRLADMDEHKLSLTKTGSWTWSEPFLADLLLLRKVLAA